MAAASIGQVHRAVLPNGRRVAVKVQRPDAPRQIEADLALLYQAAQLAKDRVRALDFIDARELVDEFARSIRQELDYRLEARNAQTFHRNFAGHPHIRVPHVLLELLAPARADARAARGRAARRPRLDEYTLDERRRLAYLMTEAWMTMIFRHGFFHGDPHPANILVLGPEQIGLVDFGQAGKLSDDDMSKLTALFIDAAEENVDALPKRLGDLGVRYDLAREAELTPEMRELYYKYYGARLSEIDPLQVIREAFRADLRAEPAAADAVRPARQGDRDARLGRRRALPGLQRLRGREAVRARPDAPPLHAAPGRAARAQGDARARGDAPRRAVPVARRCSSRRGAASSRSASCTRASTTSPHKLDVVFNRLVIALVVAGGLIGSSLIGIFAKNGPHLIGLHVISLAGFIFSGVLGLWLMIGVIRSGRLVSPFDRLGEIEPHVDLGRCARAASSPASGSTFVVVELDPGTIVPEHAHDNEQLGVLARGLDAVPDRRRGTRAGARRDVVDPAERPARSHGGPGRARSRSRCSHPRGDDWDALEQLESRLRPPGPASPDGCRNLGAKSRERTSRRLAGGRYVGRMSAALIVAEPEVATRGFLERQLVAGRLRGPPAGAAGEALDLAERAGPISSSLAELELCSACARASPAAPGTATCR